MNINPQSPFSERKLSELVGEHIREGDAWCYKLICPNEKLLTMMLISEIGVPLYGTDWAAAGPLMEREEWPWGTDFKCYKNYPDTKEGFKYEAHYVVRLPQWHLTKHTLVERHKIWGDTMTLAIRNAFIIAATYAAEQKGGAK